MKLSIIIPCYNVAPYVERAVWSVQEQAFADWELILVDDGSTDETLSVLQALAEKDYRIRVIAQANRGVSAARNTGLCQARGEYVQFIDGDDYISSYGDVERWENSDVVVYGFSMHKDKNVREFLPPREGASLLIKYLRGCRLVLPAFIFRRAFLEQEGICFDEQTYYSEDKEVMIKALFCARRIQPIQYAMYHYIRRDSSAMGTQKKLTERNFTALDAMKRLEEFVQERKVDKNVMSAVRVHRGISSLRMFRAFLRRGAVVENAERLLESELKDCFASNMLSLSWSRYDMLYVIFRMAYEISPVFLKRIICYV